MTPNSKHDDRDVAERLQELIDFDRPDLSIPILRRLIELRPRVLRYHTSLALMLFGVREIDSAEAAARLSLEMRENETGLSVLGQILVNRRQQDEGERLLRRLLEIVPDHEDALGGLAWSLALRGEHREAVGLLRHLIELRPDDADARRELGWSLLRLGDHHGAVGVLLESLELESGRVAHSWLGLAYAGMGMSVQAREEAAIAAQMPPANVDECDQQARLYDELGMEDGARAERDRCAELFGDA